MRVEMGAGSEAATTISERIAQNVSAYGVRLAIRCGASVRSWHDLGERIAAAAAQLVAAGCRPGDRVALLAENHIDYIAAFLGIVRAGASAVTLPTMLPLGTLVSLLRDCAPVGVIASPAFDALSTGMLEAAGLQPERTRFCLEPGTRTPYLFASSSAAPSLRDCGISGDAEFNIVYSSGTTAAPKGIVHSHRTRAATAAGFAGLGFDTAAVTLLSTPLYTNMSIPPFLSALWAGGTVDVLEKFEPVKYLQRAAEVGATHFFLVPTQVGRLLAVREFSTFDLSLTRLKYIAGSKLPPELKRRLVQEWPGECVEVYGMSEGAPVTMLFASRHPDKLHTVGCAPPGARVLILSEHDEILGPGQLGEVIGQTGSMMLGYNNRTAETAALTWKHPDGSMFFRSGDIGRLDADGFLEIVDRKKDVIITGGYNVYASDVEQVLAAHPQVAEVAVVGVESARWGETPVAFVVPAPGASPAAESLLSWVNERVGKYQRVARVELLAALPRNALGKVLKRELREAQQPLP